MLSVADSPINLASNTPISVVDGQRIVVSYRDDLEEWGWDVTRNNIPVALSNTLSSIKSGSENSPNKETMENLNTSFQSSTSSKSAAYQNIANLITNVSDPIDVNGKRMNISTILDLSNISDDYAGDDTQSDAFFREILKNAQYIPTPPQNIPQSVMTSTNISTTTRSTESAAYGIVQGSGSIESNNVPSPPHIYQHLNQSFVASNPNSNSTPQKPLRRFHSINEQNVNQNQPVSNISNKHQSLDETKLSPQSTPVAATQSRQKTSHLRELQNHRNFQSYQTTGTTIKFDPNHSHYPIDMNTTEEEILLLNKPPPVMANVPSPLSNVSPISSYPTAPKENIVNLEHDQQPPKPAQQLYQVDPPPLPPKNSSNCVLSQSRVPMPPPRPPPIAISANKKPYNLYNHKPTAADVPQPPPPDASYV